jgi:dTDP-glucose 4,6-dehydratase/UDP-glucose 4-epimerase
MIILVIGSEGFIGQNTKQFFRNQGFETWCADIHKEPVDDGMYIKLSIDNPDFMGLFSKVSADLCINCSGAANVPFSFQEPLNDYYLNTVNVYKILDAIRLNTPNCRFLNLSSAAVYGNPVQLPIPEDADLQPLSPYGYHKLEAENICKNFYQVFDIPTCSLRLFSVFGSGLKKQIFWDLFWKAQNEEKLTLFGSGEESRDYIHINDLVRALEIISMHSSFNGEVINVAHGEEIKIKDSTRIFFDQFNRQVDYSFSGIIRKGDPLNWQADISRLKSFGYKPAISMEKGLKEYYEWVSSIRV